MDDIESRNLRDKHTQRRRMLLLCAVALLINVAGDRLVGLLKLPLYLDNIGSALAAALGGYIPGIVVGFFTNLITGLRDYNNTYFGSLTVLIAISSAWFARRGYYDKPWKLPVIAITFALIGGGLGSVLSWTLYGFDFGIGVSAPLARRLFAMGKFSQFWAQFTADMLLDLADKAITVSIVAVVLNQMPQKLRQKLFFAGWQQTPLSGKTLKAADGRHSRGLSLRSKIILLVALAMVIIAVVVTGISFIHYRTAAIDEQVQLAKGVVNVVAQTIDPDRVDEFIRDGEAAPGYVEIDRALGHLVNSSKNIKYVYVYKIMEDGCHVVFDADVPGQEGGNPGDVIEFDDAFKDDLPKLLAGEEIDYVISDEKYGWLLTVYQPVRDSAGVTQCYGAVDIDMSHIATSGYQFLARVTSLFFGFFLLLLTAAIWLAEYNIILPINSMAMTTSHSSYDTEAARTDTVQSIKQLDIHTGDEIENLYHSVVSTTEHMVDTLENVEHQNEIISKLQNGLILVLADMVESRDKCTGDHVRKTAAYTDIIMRQLKREGVYADQLTEGFMRDVVNSAPLHDIGKIQVSDAILNKPGKLTDDEFDKMKTHTTAGADVISHAIQMVSEANSGYLKEARNLAEFHHEKWSGAGYPRGLSGEEIPLSARIMAVADVFDALVSRRSYKEGFPFEKAMAIIKEGSGTHFDPQIVNAFVHAQDEVRRVMNTHLGPEE